MSVLEAFDEWVLRRSPTAEKIAVLVPASLLGTAAAAGLFYGLHRAVYGVWLPRWLLGSVAVVWFAVILWTNWSEYEPIERDGGGSP